MTKPRAAWKPRKESHNTLPDAAGELRWLRRQFTRQLCVRLTVAQYKKLKKAAALSTPPLSMSEYARRVLAEALRCISNPS